MSSFIGLISWKAPVTLLLIKPSVLKWHLAQYFEDLKKSDHTTWLCFPQSPNKLIPRWMTRYQFSLQNHNSRQPHPALYLCATEQQLDKHSSCTTGDDWQFQIDWVQMQQILCRKSDISEGIIYIHKVLSTSCKTKLLRAKKITCTLSFRPTEYQN